MYTRDEVDVVQNLIFYIETAYKVAVSVMSSTKSLCIFKYLFFNNIAKSLVISRFLFGMVFRILECGNEETKQIKEFRKSMPALLEWQRFAFLFVLKTSVIWCHFKT